VEGQGGKKAIRVLGGVLGIQFFSGVLYTWSIFKDQLVAEYGWSEAAATLPYTVSTLVFALSMFLAGLLLDRAGARTMIRIGIFLMGGRLLLSGLARMVTAWALTFGLLTSVGVGFIYLVSTPAVIRWFPAEKRGLITGMVVAGVALSPVIFAPLAQLTLGRLGLAYGPPALSALAFFIPLALTWLIADPPQKSGTTGTGPDSLGEMSWRQMIRTPLFYLLFVMFAFSSSAGLIIFGHLTRIARLQAGWEGGYLLLMLIAVTSASGRFLGGALFGFLKKGALLRLVFLTQALTMLIFQYLRSPWTLALGVALAGLCYGAILSVFPVLTADYFGVQHLGANYGLLFVAWGMGGLLGPLVAGAVFDATGSYRLAYYLALGLLVAASFLTLFLEKLSENRDS